MYFLKLYSYSKSLCLVLFLLFAFQLINNLRQDIAVSPIYTYGMYSQVLPPEATYIVPEISVNGKALRTMDFSPQQWDKIVMPVMQFEKQAKWNSSIYNNDIRRLLHITDSSFYVNNLSPVQFNNWYKKYLEKVIDKKISTLSITFFPYYLSSETLVKIKPEQNMPAH